LGIKKVDGIIAQTKAQKKAFELLTGKNVCHLPSIFSPTFGDSPRGNTPISGDDFILWVGSNTDRKRPLIFFDLAQQFPDLSFVMVFSPGDGTGGIEVNAGPQNLKFVASCPRDRLKYYYMQSMMLVSTSKLEGFPNVFLETWWHKKPVLSLDVDPDGIIEKLKLGKVVSDMAALCRELKQLSANKKLRISMGENAHRYVRETHASEKIIGRFHNYLTTNL